MVQWDTRIEEDTEKVERTPVSQISEVTNEDDPYAAAPIYRNQHNIQLRLISRQLRVAAQELREQSRRIRSQSAEVRMLAESTRAGSSRKQAYRPVEYIPRASTNGHSESQSKE